MAGGGDEGGGTPSVDISVAVQQTLETVVVTGTAVKPMTNDVTVYIDGDCQTGPAGFIDPTPIDQKTSSGAWRWLLKKLLGDPIVSACSFMKDAAARCATSQSSDIDRQLAGAHIIDLKYQGPSRLMMNGETVTVVYTDGGTEDFEFVTMATHQRIPGTLKQGDGINRCPP